MTVHIPNHLTETVTVRIGVLGWAGEGIGTADVDVELEGDGYERARAVGEAMGRAFHDAYMTANLDFAPIVRDRWRDQAERARDTEG